MSAETVRHYPLDFDDAQTRAWKESHKQSFSETLDSEEFGRFLQLPPDALNNVLAKAYFKQQREEIEHKNWVEVKSTRTEYTDAVLAAYLDFLSSNNTLEHTAEAFDVTPLDIQSLAENMPGYLGDAVPAVLWSGRPIGASVLQKVVHVVDLGIITPDPVVEKSVIVIHDERFDVEQEPEAEIAPVIPIPLVTSVVAVPPGHARVVDQEVPKGPDLPPYDFSPYEFYETDPHNPEELAEARSQGQALMAKLEATGVVDGNLLWEHLGEDKERTKRMNNAFHKVHARFERNREATKHLKIGMKPFNALAHALLQKPNRQAESHLTALATTTAGSTPGAVRDIEKARCCAFGIIAELYADELVDDASNHA